MLIKNDSFVRLGELRILFEAVESRTRAVASLAHESILEPAKHALKFISWCIAERHDAILSSVISLAGRLAARVAEGVLLRALRALEELDNIDSRGGSARESQTKLRSIIMQKLFKMYLARNDVPEAENWLRRLDMLPNDSKHNVPSMTAQQLAHSLQRTSKMAQGILEGLELDQDIRGKLRFSKLASFPAIHRAIGAGHVKSAQILSSMPAALMELDILGRTALHVAAETGQVKSLGVQFTSDTFNSPDAFQCTPLFLAAYNGNFESFAFLVERGADIKARTSGGRSVMAAACSAGHLKIVQYLLQKGIDPNDNLVGVPSPLWEAASHGHLEVCQALLKEGAVIDCFADPCLSMADTTVHKASKEILEMIQKARGNKPAPLSRCLITSEDNSEAVSDPPSPIRPTQFPVSGWSSTFASSTAADHETNICDSEDSGFCDEQSWENHGAGDVPVFEVSHFEDVSVLEDMWSRPDFL